ncbi:MAG: tetratricopeptide repeat protein [Deltaproteobacteria bacterium]|nr:tetratricopeptide repeat protein [Deltaproteobacteria bacterium]
MPSRPIGNAHRARRSVILLALGAAAAMSLALSGCDKAKTDAIALVNQGVAALERGDVGTAQSNFARATRLDPENATAHYQLGLVLRYHREEPAEALKHFQTAEQLSPDDPDVLYQIGRLQTSEGQAESGLTYLNRAIEADPNMEPAWYFKGEALKALGRLQDADAAWREAIAIQPQDARPFLALAAMYEAHDADDAARAVYEAGLRHNGGNADLLNSLGVLELRRNQNDAAIKHLNDALSRDGSRTDALFNLSFAFAQAGKTKEAIQHLGAYVTHADPLTEKGNLRVARGLHEALVLDQERARREERQRQEQQAPKPEQKPEQPE